jgi:hypothetical protein
MRDVDTTDAVGAGVVVVVAAGTVVAASPSSNAGPALTFVGAILVALITAVTTNRRQRTQLEAEGVRQERELTVERERLDRQLEHDRELRDLDHLRTFLDDAAALFETANGKLSALQAMKLPEPTSESSPDETSAPPGRVEEQVRVLEEASEAFSDLMVMGRRFDLRFPPSNRVRLAYVASVDALFAEYRAVRDVAEPVTGDQERHIDELASASMAAWAAFNLAAGRLMGVVQARE